MADRGYTPYVTKRWHFIVGCVALSEGCRHCWAAFQAYRMALSKSGAFYRGLARIGRNGYEWVGKVRKDFSRLSEPLKWRGEIIWVAPMSDPFHEQLSDAEIVSYFVIIAHSYLLGLGNVFFLLTKRVERMQKLYTSGWLHSQIEKELGKPIPWPLPNTQEGVSIEDQRSADERLPLLAATPSCYRTISAQPILKRLDIRDHAEPGVFNYAVLGGEAGPMARLVDSSVIFDVQAQLRECEVPYLTMCDFPVRRQSCHVR